MENQNSLKELYVYDRIKKTVTRCTDITPQCPDSPHPDGYIWYNFIYNGEIFAYEDKEDRSVQILRRNNKSDIYTAVVSKYKYVIYQIYVSDTETFAEMWRKMYGISIIRMNSNNKEFEIVNE